MRLPPPSVQERQAREGMPQFRTTKSVLNPSSTQSTGAGPAACGGCSIRAGPEEPPPSSAPSSEVTGHTRLPGPYLPCPDCSLAANPQHGAEHTVGALDICRRTEGAAALSVCHPPATLQQCAHLKKNPTLSPPREDVRSTMQTLGPKR